MKLYLAGPDVFRRDAVRHGAALQEQCRRAGHEGLWPLDNDCSSPLEIARANEAMIRRADAVLANLSPFRGPSADVGTAFEVGFARALGKPVVGWTSARGPYRDRVSRGPISSQRDADGMLIEDFGLFDNLMLAHAVDGLFPSFEAALRRIPAISTLAASAATQR